MPVPRTLAQLKVFMIMDCSKILNDFRLYYKTGNPECKRRGLEKLELYKLRYQKDLAIFETTLYEYEIKRGINIEY